MKTEETKKGVGEIPTPRMNNRALATCVSGRKGMGSSDIVFGDSKYLLDNTDD